MVYHFIMNYFIVHHLDYICFLYVLCIPKVYFIDQSLLLDWQNLSSSNIDVCGNAVYWTMDESRQWNFEISNYNNYIFKFHMHTHNLCFLLSSFPFHAHLSSKCVPVINTFHSSLTDTFYGISFLHYVLHLHKFWAQFYELMLW